MTAAELFRLPDDGWRYELLRGRLVREPPAGGEHSWIGVNLAGALRDFLRAGHSGYVFGPDCGFRIASTPDTVRAPDVSFVRADRLPDGPPAGYLPFAPDLAVEIISPTDRMATVLRKVMEYLDAGSALVWIIDPATRTGTVHRPGGRTGLMGIDGILEAEEILPGFRLPLRDLLD